MRPQAIPSLLLIVLLIGALGWIGHLWHLALWGSEPVVVAAPPPNYHWVEPGDTLWSIAKLYWPGGHTGERVHQIRQINPGLDPGRLQIGQKILLAEVE